MFLDLQIPDPRLTDSRLRDRSRRPEGVNGSRSKFLSKFNQSAYIPKSPKPSSVLTKVRSSYWKTKPTQKASNERAKPRSRSEANRKNCRTDLPGLVWPVHRTSLTGRVCSKTSRPVWPVLPTGLTGGTQKTPENLEDTSTTNLRTYPQEIFPKWSMKLENLRKDQEGLGFSQKLKNFNSEELAIPEGLARG